MLFGWQESEFDLGSASYDDFFRFTFYPDEFPEFWCRRWMRKGSKVEHILMYCTSLFTSSRVIFSEVPSVQLSDGLYFLSSIDGYLVLLANRAISKPIRVSCITSFFYLFRDGFSLGNHDDLCSFWFERVLSIAYQDGELVSADEAVLPTLVSVIERILSIDDKRCTVAALSALSQLVYFDSHEVARIVRSFISKIAPVDPSIEELAAMVLNSAEK